MTDYDTDFAQWAEEQAAKLRAGVVTELDRENLAEELDSLVRALRRELADRLVRLLQNLAQWHLLAENRLLTWYVAIEEERSMIPALLEDAPSLRDAWPDTFAHAWQRARDNLCQTTELKPELLSPQCPYSSEQVFDVTFWPT
jgi:hypothetical protein